VGLMISLVILWYTHTPLGKHKMTFNMREMMDVQLRIFPQTLLPKMIRMPVKQVVSFK